jgi:CHAD domain-containing protein
MGKMIPQAGSSVDETPLIAHLDSLVSELCRRVQPALEEFNQEDVHKARVGTRRLKAALELLSRVLDRGHRKPLARIGKKLRQRLGPLRDVDVMLHHLDEINVAAQPAAAGAEWLRDRLLRDRDKARARSRDEASPAKVIAKLGAWHAVRRDLLAAQAAVPTLLAESVHTQLDAFIDQANQLRARIEGDDAADPVDTQHDPHQLRIAGKSLRYTLELADAQGMDLPKGLLGTFKHMQESLGSWHDFVVMAERAMQASLDEDLPLHDPRKQREVLALIEYAMQQAQVELEGFSQLWDEKGQSLTDAIRGAFPLTRPAVAPASPASPAVTESQTDPDPAGSVTTPAPEDVSPDSPPAA